MLTEKEHKIKGAKVYTHKNNQAHKVRVSSSLTKIDTHSPNLQVSKTYKKMGEGMKRKHIYAP